MQRAAMRLCRAAACAAVLGGLATASSASAEVDPAHALAEKFSRAADESERAEEARKAEAARKEAAKKEAARRRAAEASRKAKAEARRKAEAERRAYEAEMLQRARSEAEARHAAQERAEKEAKEQARLKAERDEALRIAREARQRRLEAARRAEEARKAKAAKLARELEEKRRKEKQARIEAEREAARAQAARLAREAEQRRLEAARRAEEARKAEAERLAREVEAQRRADASKAEEARRAKEEQAALEAKRQEELRQIAEKFRLAREARERAAREREERARVAKEEELQRTRNSLGGPRPAQVYERPPERVTVLLIVEPRRRGKPASPVLCISKSCYVSAGAENDARRMSRARALGPGNTIGRRAGPCNKQRTCVYRNVYLGNVGSIQPVDLGFWGHKRHDIYTVRPDKSCDVLNGQLSCASPIIAHGYRAWVVPEAIAARAGVDALEDALEEGLPTTRSAALGDWSGTVRRQDR